ncbi:MAG TPA: superinfection immunity protein [Steroidobacteraceae bacterium]|nr:superinfection immunity protein [Steroidobacteraceae bacterium]
MTTFLLICAALYFLPTIVAAARDRHNKGAIFLLNFFLGWTFVGWVVSLVWAVSSSPPPTVVIQQPPRQ